MLFNRASALASWGFLFLCVAPAVAQATKPVPSEATRPAVFVFVDRTDRHAKYSSSEVFHSLVDDTFVFLRESRVSIAVDEVAGRYYSENPTPLETILNIARDSHATSVLYLNVDRPFTKWIKVTVRCYDTGGKLLWKGKAESGGGLTGGHGLEVTEKKLHELLQKRLGQESLPLLAAEANKAELAQADESTAGAATPFPKVSVLLPEGTVVLLQLAQDVSSRAAQPDEPIELTLAEDLEVNNVVVAKAGSRALGVVVHAKGTGFGGEGGALNVRLKFLQVSGSQVPLRGTAGQAGRNNVLIGGGQAVLKTGTPVKAYVAEDTMVTPE